MLVVVLIAKASMKVAIRTTLRIGGLNAMGLYKGYCNLSGLICGASVRYMVTKHFICCVVT